MYARFAIASAAVVVIAAVGISLLPDGARSPGGGRTTASLSPPPSPATSASPTPITPSDVGFIGLPPVGARPSTPELGQLVDSYIIHAWRLPFEGSVQLYADGRLIWYMFYDGPAGHNAYSTGYLEQRLTAEGVELLRNHQNIPEKDPLRIPEWMPPSAWEDQRIRAYVPPGYAACFGWRDPAAVGPINPPQMEPSVMLAALPATARDVLRGKEVLEMSRPPEGATPYCLALTTEEARRFDAALSAADLEQDEQANRYVLEYQLDAPGPGTMLVIVWFEPHMPDGTIGCSSCG